LFDEPDNLLVVVKVDNDDGLHSLTLSSLGIDKINMYQKLMLTFLCPNNRNVYSWICEKTRRLGECVEDITRVEIVSDFEKSLG